MPESLILTKLQASVQLQASRVLLCILRIFKKTFFTGDLLSTAFGTLKLDSHIFTFFENNSLDTSKIELKN